MTRTPPVKGHKATYRLATRNIHGNGWQVTCECGWTRHLTGPGSHDGLRLHHRWHRQHVLDLRAIATIHGIEINETEALGLTPPQGTP